MWDGLLGLPSLLKDLIQQQRETNALLRELIALSGHPSKTPVSPFRSGVHVPSGYRKRTDRDVMVVTDETLLRIQLEQAQKDQRDQHPGAPDLTPSST